MGIERVGQPFGLRQLDSHVGWDSWTAMWVERVGQSCGLRQLDSHVD